MKGSVTGKELNKTSNVPLVEDALRILLSYIASSHLLINWESKSHSERLACLGNSEHDDDNRSMTSGFISLNVLLCFLLFLSSPEQQAISSKEFGD